MADAATLSLSTTVVATEQQISCDVGDEAVLLSVDDGEYYALNAVAASIWRLLQQPRTVEAMRDALLAEYRGVSVEDCEREVISLVGELVALGMAETR